MTAPFFDDNSRIMQECSHIYYALITQHGGARLALLTAGTKKESPGKEFLFSYSRERGLTSLARDVAEMPGLAQLEESDSLSTLLVFVKNAEASLLVQTPKKYDALFDEGWTKLLEYIPDAERYPIEEHITSMKDAGAPTPFIVRAERERRNAKKDGPTKPDDSFFTQE